MTTAGPWLPAILLLACLQIALMVISLYDLWKRREVRHLPKSLWAVVIIIFNFIGPVAYLLLGRGRTL